MDAWDGFTAILDRIETMEIYMQLLYCTPCSRALFEPIFLRIDHKTV